MKYVLFFIVFFNLFSCRSTSTKDEVLDADTHFVSQSSKVDSLHENGQFLTVFLKDGFAFPESQATIKSHYPNWKLINYDSTQYIVYSKDSSWIRYNYDSLTSTYLIIDGEIQRANIQEPKDKESILELFKISKSENAPTLSKISIVTQNQISLKSTASFENNVAYHVNYESDYDIARFNWDSVEYAVSIQVDTIHLMKDSISESYSITFTPISKAEYIIYSDSATKQAYVIEGKIPFKNVTNNDSCYVITYDSTSAEYCSYKIDMPEFGSYTEGYSHSGHLLKSKTLLLANEGWEASGVNLISTTHDSRIASSEAPVHSPNQLLFICGDAVGNSQGTENFVSYYSLTDSGFVQLYNSDEYGYFQSYWLNDSTSNLSVYYNDYDHLFFHVVISK